ncbi:MAG: hypothetical protein AAGE89_00235 [Pseudomonadota bacterium]
MKKTLFTALVLSSGTASAHPGHEAAHHEGVMHWVTQADHLALLVVVFLAGAFAVGGLVSWMRSSRDHNKGRMKQ